MTSTLLFLSIASATFSSVFSFSLLHHRFAIIINTNLSRLAMSDGPAGSFFNQVPDKNDDDDDDDEPLEELQLPFPPGDSFTSSTLMQQQSIIGMGGSTASPVFKPYVALGPPDVRVNDVTKPEYDKDGYTVYTNEQTGEKSRVFEALVEYPCDFTMKIVGAKDETFVQDVVQIVADSCQVEMRAVSYTTREMGKWTSVTVQAPVVDAEMLYQLYENIDKDPRVKFKF